MRHFVELELGMKSGWLKNPDGEATGEGNERIKRGAAKGSEKLKRVEEKRPFKTKNARARILMSTSDGGESTYQKSQISHALKSQNHRA